MSPSYESEIAFISGVDGNGIVVPISFTTWNGLVPPGYLDQSKAVKWGLPTPGTEATISYFFEEDSHWSADEMTAWRSGMALWSAVADIKFVEHAEEATANFVIERGNDGRAFQAFGSQTLAVIGTNQVGTPGDADSFISIDTSVPRFGPISTNLQTFGGHPVMTLVHELGHLLGLGHGGPYNFAVDDMVQQFSAYDTLLWATMSYVDPWAQPTKFFDEYPVTGTNWNFEQTINYWPLTPMMLDILAVQRLYGVATSGPLASGGHVFGFNANIGGDIRAFYDFTVNIHPVLTLWSGGTGNKLDLSGFSQDATVNLNPGTFSSAGGLVNNIGIAVGTVIETAIGGSGNDWMTASDAGSTLDGGASLDRLFGGDGIDVLTGGASPDTIYVGRGTAWLRDTLANMNGDTVYNFGPTTTIEVVGAMIGRDGFAVATAGGTTTLVMADTQIVLQSAYGSGDFMSVVRGADGMMRTLVTFDTFLPALSEGVAVEPGVVNGIANQPFLTGDGNVAFTMTLQAAISAFANTLGCYKVARDGTIVDVDVIWANTLAVPSGQLTVALGTPGDGERLGFFLVQDAFGRFGGLPDDLSFLADGTLMPATLDGGVPVLSSTSLGPLPMMTVFHSFADLNPGGDRQVLSGTAPGGEVLRIGFEDLAYATGDQDFQDIVISISVNNNDLFFV